MNQRQTGAAYEEKAANYLMSQGFRILERNFYTHFGEIDLIAEEGDILVFVEVKYRRDLKNGYPQEAVTPAKRRKIVRSAQYYLYRTRREDCICRFDVIAIVGEEITHIKAAFEES